MRFLNLSAMMLLLAVAGCRKKDAEPSPAVITGTVIQLQWTPCNPDDCLVQIDRPLGGSYPFLCESVMIGDITNCAEAVILQNVPSRLRVPGKKIRFTQWSDLGILCQTSPKAPHYLAVNDLQEN